MAVMSATAVNVHAALSITDLPKSILNKYLLR